MKRNELRKHSPERMHELAQKASIEAVRSAGGQQLLSGVEALDRLMEARSRFLPYYYVLVTGIQFYVLQKWLPRLEGTQATILDLCCSNGLFFELLMASCRGFSHRAGLDLSEAGVIAAGQRHVYDVVTVADARRLPFASDYFDVVLSNSSIEHIPHVEQVLSEVGRVLKSDPPGQFLLTVPLPKFVISNFPWLWLLPDQLRTRILQSRYFQFINVWSIECWQEKLESAGFEIIGSQTYMSDFTMQLACWALWWEVPLWAISERLFGQPIILPRSKVLLRFLYRQAQRGLPGQGELLVLAQKRGTNPSCSQQGQATSQEK